MRIRTSPNAGERGTAVVVVLALLFLILAFMAGNNVTLRSLQREVDLIEKRQLRKYEPPRAPAAPGYLKPRPLERERPVPAVGPSEIRGGAVPAPSASANQGELDAALPSAQLDHVPHVVAGGGAGPVVSPP